jgi:hypothetical protein
MSDDNTFRQVLRDLYDRIVIRDWPLGAGGVLIGLTSVLVFCWDRPWGVVGGLRIWADWLFYGVGLYAEAPPPALVNTNSVIVLGLIWGALAASLLSRNFAFRVPPRLELAKGVVGGILIGTGAALAGGCNVGGFYSSISAMSLSGVVMMAGLLAGAWAGLKYLYWEMEHLPSGGTAARPAKTGGFDWKRVQPWMGWLLLAAAYGAWWLYRLDGYPIEGGVLLFGVVFGVILVKSRFCFARAFREPFMTGEAEVTKAVAVSLLISMLGFAVIKWAGLRPEMAYVAPNFGLGALVGGFIFGFGMLMTGGCGSGTAWRAAEGQIKLIVALFFFAASNSLVRAGLAGFPALERLVGTRVFLPHYLGYQAEVAALAALLAAWWVWAAWNEETDRFVVGM